MLAYKSGVACVRGSFSANQKTMATPPNSLTQQHHEQISILRCVNYGIHCQHTARHADPSQLCHSCARQLASHNLKLLQQVAKMAKRKLREEQRAFEEALRSAKKMRKAAAKQVELTTKMEQLVITTKDEHSITFSENRAC